MSKFEPILRIENVSRHFGSVAALDGVSFEIAPGEIVCLVGHSGCGKSTLLRTISGVEQIDGGSVMLAGTVVSGAEGFVEPEDRNIGFMFQDYALFPHLTARQNIGFGLRGMSRKDAATRVGDVIARLEIEALAERYPHMLSGGEQQRVALARALAPQPRILLMDEPFSNLDRGLRDTIRRETVALLRQLGTTAIVVTHDPEEALAIGDKVVLMHKGKVIESGTGDAIYSFPQTAYAAAFFSQVNRIPARRSGDWLDSALGRFPAPCGSSGPVQLFIRPQALTLNEGGTTATVKARVLLGEIEELTLDVAGLDDPLVMRTSARRGVEVGQRVSVGVAPNDVLVFAADEAARSTLPHGPVAAE
ncbi:ABC transporter ATP-binding protein [Pelagibacterium nitratireducens]|uniref:ABC transporter ATP-binding protein n=1 Tax=Pelagibacterium nitratireducens TaxID=1046114 RepID=A0ABZ2HYH0_9HYPH|tara:strand:+ start:2601 stop:3686 length:1086 start_codon:yes stop_codon:yes gene_type:complete